MKCPYCSHAETKVTNKRDINNRIRRRRECLRCNKRFTTYETVTFRELIVIKKDKRKEKFSREKLIRGLNLAFEKRPIKPEIIEKIAHDIEQLCRKKGTMINTSFIGGVVLKKLAKIDQIAYIRFASVYKEFKDPEEFTLMVNQ